MADSTTTHSVLVDIIAKGMERMLKQLDDVGTGVETVNKKQKEASKTGKDFYDTQAKGVIGTANSARSFSKLSQTIGDNNSGLVGAYATLAANAFAVSAAFNALRSAAQTQQLLEGLETQGARTGKALTLTAAAVKEITGAAVSSADSMKAVAQFSAAGFSSAQLLEVTQVATDASKALGRNIPDSLDRIIKGASKLEPELLDELGLMTKLGESSKAYALANDKTAESLTSFEKRQGFLNAIIAEGTLKFGGISDKVKASPYDQLASSFDNLTKTILNTVNAFGGLAIVSTLSGNMLTLFGAMVLFGSTISKKLVPGLYEFSEASIKAKAALEEKIKVQQKAIDTNLKQVKSEQEAAKQSLKSTLTVPEEGRAKKYREYVDAVRAGNATEQQRISALKSLTGSMKLYQDKLNAGFYKTQEEIDSKTAIIAAHELNKAAILREADAQTTSTAITSAATKKQAVLAAQGSSLRLQASAQILRANAIEAAGNGQVAQSMALITTSTTRYAAALKIKTRAVYEAAAAYSIYNQVVYRAAIALDTLKIATFGFVTAIKAVGAAVLSALNWIGLIVIAVGMAIQAYDKFLKPEATKIKEKAFENLKTVVDNTTEAIKEYDRIGTTSASLASRTEALLTNQANSALELSNSYMEAYASLNQLQKEQAKEPVKKTDPFGDLYGEQTRAAKQVGLDIDSLAVRAFEARIGFSGFNKETALSVKTLDQLIKVNPEVTKGILDTNDQIEAFRKLKPAEQFKLVNEMAQKTAEKFKQTVPAITAVSQALQQADTDAGAFLKSMDISTPFDKMVNSLRNVNTALYDLQKTSVDARDAVALLTGMGPDLEKYLTPDNAVLIDTLKLTDSTVSALNAKKKAGEQLTRNEELQVILGEKVLRNSKSLLEPVKENLDNARRTFEVAQKATREAQLQAGLIQAIMSKNAEAYSAGAAGMKAQIAREEQIRGLQVKGLQLQKTAIDNAIRQQREALISLQTEFDKVEALKAQGDVIDLNTLKTAKLIATSLGINLYAADIGNDPKLAAMANLENAETEIAKNAKTADDEKAARLREFTHKKTLINNSIADSEASSKALQLQISTIMTANLTTQQKATREQAAENQLLKQESDLVRKNTRTKEDNARALVNLVNTASGTVDTLGAKLDSIASNYASDTADLIKKSSDDILSIEDSISITEANRAAASKTEQAGYDRRLENLRRVLEATQEDQKLSLQGLNIARQQKELEAIGLNTVEQRIAKQKEALSFAQYQLDALKESATLQSSLTASINAVQRKRAGVTDTATSQSMDELENAQTAYKLAAAEVKLKVTMINLEFALIAAKRTQMLDEMKKSATELADRRIFNTAEGISDPQLETRIKAANDIIKSIESVGNMSLEAARDSLIKAAYESVDILKNGITLALTEGPKIKGGFVEQLANSVQKGQAAKNKQAAYEAQVGPKDYAPGFKPNFALDLAATAMEDHISRIKDSLVALGPEGELVLAVAQGAMNMGRSFQDFGKALAGTDFKAKAAAGLEVVSQGIAMVQGILQASSNAKLASIDKEIAAEQKRDGKSAASVAKIMEMEKKKDAIAKKSFETQKKLQMAQIVVSTAAAAMGAAAGLAQLPLGAGLPFIPAVVGAMVALGAAQLAIVAGTSYQGGAGSMAAAAPSGISIGKQSSSVDLAKGANANAGGEVGFLRGSSGSGSNASNYRTIGSAYGGELVRGYGSRGFVVGEKGPEKINMDTPITVSPVNDNNNGSAPITANINIQALDSSDVQRVLLGQRGNLIKMFREAANATGKTFLEDVNTNVYTRPGTNRL